MLRLTHIINPVNVSSKSDLYFAQPVTFESLHRAVDFARNDIKVELITAQFREDHDIIPDYFVKTKDLERSIMDFESFARPRKLPLIKDILDKAYEVSTGADYIIYSNVDIAVMPYFYLYVNSRIKDGCDCLIINRRTISNDFTDVRDLSYMYAQLGDAHPGYDCFVFKRAAYPHFVLGNTCIGANWIGRVLYGNLLTFSQSLFIERRHHLTFHIGNEGAWLSGEYNDYDAFNKKETYNVMRVLHSCTPDKSKKEELTGVIEFMDNWGKQTNVGASYKGYKNKIIKKIKKYLK